jgi:hypothetical protein
MLEFDSPFLLAIPFHPLSCETELKKPDPVPKAASNLSETFLSEWEDVTKQNIWKQNNPTLTRTASSRYFDFNHLMGQI